MSASASPEIPARHLHPCGDGRFPALVEAVCAAALVICAALFVWFTRHWPLVGDVSMVDYLVLLMQRGMAPYRQIVDPQMPGAYLITWAALHVFGWGAVGLRLFDLAILAAATAAGVAIAGPANRFAGFFAGAMLAVIHGRDGIPQAAQRDLIMAALLMAAYAFAFHARRADRPWAMAASGFCAGCAATIKPTVAPLEFALLAVLAFALAREGKSWRGHLAAGVGGMLLPGLLVLAFLQHARALPQFLEALRGMWPYYAALARRPLGYLLLHSISPLLTPVLLWLAVTLLAIFSRRPLSGSANPPQRDWERVALWVGLAFSFASYVMQGKGFPYHRYPELAFLLLLFGLDFTAALRRRGALCVLGAFGLGACALVIAPISVWKTRQYQWNNLGAVGLLERDLNRLGGAPALDGKVQCLDTYSGCINALYLLRIQEATGFLTDLYFWDPRPNPVTASMRRRFWAQLERKPPAVFVITRQDYPRPDTYEKMDRWPRFKAYLNANYHLALEERPSETMWWSARPEMPIGFRIYLRNGAVLPPG